MTVRYRCLVFKVEEQLCTVSESLLAESTRDAELRTLLRPATEIRPGVRRSSEHHLLGACC